MTRTSDNTARAPWAKSDFLLVPHDLADRVSCSRTADVVQHTAGPLEDHGLVLFHHRDANPGPTEFILGDWPSTPGSRIEFDNSSVRISSDTEGAQHLYHSLERGVIVGTRIDDVLDLAGRDLDDHGLEEFLAIGYPLGNKTLFKNVQRLGSATTITIQGKSQSGPRVEFNALTLPGMAAPEVALQNLATQTAKLCDDGAFIELSGGYDSRLVVALALHGGAQKIHAFTLGSEKTSDGASASMLADAASIDLQLLSYPKLDSPEELEHQGRRMMSAGGYILNFCEYGTFPEIFRILANARTAQINGLGGELYTGSFDTPGDELAARSGPTRRAWIKERMINSAHFFERIWPRAEGRHRLRGVIRRLEQEIMNYPGVNWREKTRAFYRLTKMRNWGGAVISASNHWYDVHSPLWSRDFRAWSLGSDDNQERTGQRGLTNRLFPDFESVPYQKELELRPEFKAQMQNRSNSVAGKIMLRLFRRRWLSGPAVENFVKMRDHTPTRDLLRTLSNQESIGKPRFDLLLDLPPEQAAHATGVGITAGMASTGSH